MNEPFTHDDLPPPRAAPDPVRFEGAEEAHVDPALRAVIDAVLRVVPWPTLALDGQAALIACSDEVPSNAPMVGDGLRGRWPHYRDALAADGRGLLAPRTVDTSRPDASGRMLHEQLVLRPAEWGLCLFVIDQTELRTLRTDHMQTARLAALGFMIAGVAHELSNPLTSVRSIVQLLRSQAQPNAELLRKGLDNIGSNVQRILEISRRLLGFSRLGDEPRSEFAVALAIDEALSSARADGLFERIKLTVRHDPRARVHGNMGQLREVFSNLLLNAAQAMDGKGQIDVRTQRTLEGLVDVAIVDGGPGIPPEVAPRIFDAFFTTKPGGTGTGLGLAISQQILAEHGGRLWFENNADGGATFHAELPLADPCSHETTSRH
jgi:two-component system NtrC family sensor kinase